MAQKDQLQKTAKNILQAVGGKDNVSHVTHCMTRLRFNLKDESIPKQEEIKKIPGVIGVLQAGGQYQVVIGQTVDQVYKFLSEIGGFKSESVMTATEKPQKKKLTLKSLGSNILDGLAGSLTPLIPVMLAASMFKLLVAVLGPSMLGLINENSDVYTLLTFVGDAGFYFFPVIVGYTAAKKFGATPVVAMFLGGIMLHPTFVSMASEGREFTVFGIPAQVQNYSSTILPIIMSVWVMSYVEKFFKKYLPSVLKTIFAPSLTILVMLPISLIVLGPAGSFIGSYISKGLLGLGDIGGGFIAVAIIAALWQFLVMSGMHLVMISTLILVFSESGYESLITPAAGAASLAVSGMCLGIALRLKNKEERALSMGYMVAGLVGGVTEPGLYGVGIRYKRPFIGLVVGAFVGGLYGGITHVTSYALIPVASVLLSAGFVGGTTANLVNGIITITIAFVVSAVVTYILGVKEEKTGTPAPTKLTSDRDVQESSAIMGSTSVFAPLYGEVIPLIAIGDGVFSEGELGTGCGMKPARGELYAPFDGEVAVIAKTKHAFALRSHDGIEILVHVGIDTVKLKGKGFEPLVNVGDTIKRGQLIMNFSLAEIETAGYSSNTAIIVTNSDLYTNDPLINLGFKNPPEKIMELYKASVQ